jgi:hypothetical protein
LAERSDRIGHELVEKLLEENVLPLLHFGHIGEFEIFCELLDALERLRDLSVDVRFEVYGIRCLRLRYRVRMGWIGELAVLLRCGRDRSADGRSFEGVEKRSRRSELKKS